MSIKYTYIFKSPPAYFDKHIEAINHACAMASLYNDVIIIFCAAGVDNFTKEDKRIKSYKSLSLFGINKIIIDKADLQKNNIHIAHGLPVESMNKTDYQTYIDNADVVF